MLISYNKVYCSKQNVTGQLLFGVYTQFLFSQTVCATEWKIAILKKEVGFLRNYGVASVKESLRTKQIGFINWVESYLSEEMKLTLC